MAEQQLLDNLKQGKQKKVNCLFPIRLDITLMESSTAWTAHINLTQHIRNFENWKNHDEFQVALGRLLCDLKTEASRRL